MPIKEPQALNSVNEFHELFNAYSWDKLHMPDKAVTDLRISLLQEELNELKQAIEDNDLVEIIDALADLQYVLSWAVLAWWAQENFADIFAEVQRSNMSKACKTMEEAEATVDYYKKERDMEWYIKQKWDVFLVYRVWDDKVLKSINYSPANLEQFIN